MPRRRKSKKETGRRRRGKKDVILDFTKRITKKTTADATTTTTTTTPTSSKGKPTTFKDDAKQSNPGRVATIIKASTKKLIAQADAKMKSVGGRKAKGKLSLATSSSEYGGSLGLPEKITQREFETTGQFFRRLDRLAAKAKVEASMEARFDMTLPKEGQKIQSSTKKSKMMGGGGDLNLNDNDDDNVEQKVQHSYNKKRVKR